MRVLQFRHLCDTGGVASVTLLHAAELERRGIANEFWFCRASARLPEFQATGRTTVGTLSALADRLARGDVDIVHAPASDPASPLLARLVGRARVVVTDHGALADVWQRDNCFGHTAVSAGAAMLNQPLTDMEIRVVRNAVDTQRFTRGAAATGRPIVAFVGRTTATEKDFARFTRIAARLARFGVRVWIADPHDGRQKPLPADAVAVDAERWAPVASADMPAFYQAVAASRGCVLITSRSEGFGMAAAEAAACGAFVVAPHRLGLDEAVVDGVTGHLFPPDATEAEVAQRVGDLVGHANADAVAEAAQVRFAPARMTDEYLAVYRDGCGPRVHREPLPNVPELPLLQAHLAQQRRWQGRIALDEVSRLAGGGRRSLAAWAFGMAVTRAPRTVASPIGARAALGLLRGLVASP